MRQLDVLTWNLWGLPWPLARQRRRRFARAARWLSRQAWDLVALQEAWHPHHRELAVPGLRRVEDRGDAGLAVSGTLARNASLEQVRFAARASVDRFKAKGLLLAHTGGLVMASTHLQAGLRHASVRRAQLEQLLAVLAERREPVVLLGDLNLHGDHETDLGSARLLGDAGFRDVAQALRTAAPTWSPRNPFVPTGAAPERFDRIYVRDGELGSLVPVRVRTLPAIASDHLPVAASLIWRS